ncbi:hypothetical protein BN873_40012 [Candidatus Competibacter denitrificans Run_A_D11]|uniref:ABC transporter substrate-binding protein n=1 Tax=Candidatus Competibacter denitrificans Run_A_D11 TaxID=1400863 RepID=W6M651_9GAMM|nr:ABC transporter substrate binding protein [Candidatus Competibacter denitrificans]CDI03152.1 hypothetical protein BN873_40012 [Candidatus Competibacter denitrificans Run_A_D11]
MMAWFSRLCTTVTLGGARAISIFLSVVFYFLWIGALRGEVLIIYPEVTEPFREAFTQMIMGVTKAVGEPIQTQRLPITATREDFRQLLANRKDQAILLLGQRPLSFYEERLMGRSPVFISGIDALPGQIKLPGVSLAIDPALSLRALRDLLPHLEKVVVYYDARDQPWLERIKQLAQAQNCAIESISVKNATDVARALGETFKSINPQTMALWFGRDTIAYNTEVLYPYILEQSWDRRVAVISDTLAHVRRGFLLAYYPDFASVGSQVGYLIHRRDRPVPVGLQWSASGHLSLNVRTAKHLGIEIPAALLQQATPVFPTP